jgi:2-polyprenyl-3-methyl-5-hydroxy-6-metoxy-1,4-benzoquinol methylase
MARSHLQAYAQLNENFGEDDTFTVERYQQFQSFFPDGTRTVLDVGCSTGRGGSALAEKDHELRLAGLDCLREDLNKLPDVYGVRLQSLSTAIPARGGSFDVVVAGEFIEHLYATDVGATLAEFFRVLRIGGRLLLTTPNPADLKRRLRHQTVLGRAHVSQHHPKALRMQLLIGGFSRIRMYGSGKTSRYLGSRFPLLSAYGSYLAVADKW